LGVCIDEQNSLSLAGEHPSKIEGGSRFANAALMIEQADDCHIGLDDVSPARLTSLS